MDIPKLPQLERLPMRLESEVKDKEIWQPRWNCFCCEDSGLVKPNLVKLVIPSYDYGKDKLPRCQNCEAGEHYENPAFDGCLDFRLNEDICQKLDNIARTDWKQVIGKKQRGEKLFEIDYSTVVKSLRKRSRSQQEQELAQRNHLEERAK